MKTLILNASHRKNGYCDIIQELILKNAAEHEKTDTVKLIDKKIGFCRACDYCAKHDGACVIDDDANALINEMKYAENIVVISPVYFSSLPSAIKLLIERCQMLYNTKELDLPKKNFGLILIGGSLPYKSQFLGAKATFTHMLKDLNAKITAEVLISASDTFKEDLPADVKREIIEFVKTMMI